MFHPTYFFLLIFFCGVFCGSPAPGPAPASNTSSCSFTVSGKTYDLTPLSKSPVPGFTDSSGIVYTVSFCSPLVCADNKYSGNGQPGACRVSPGETDNNGVIDSFTTAPLPSNYTQSGFQLQYHNGSKGCTPGGAPAVYRRTIINLLCGSGDGTIINATQIIPTPPGEGCTYLIELQTKYVCSGGFGVGWILIIIIFAAAVLYLIIGAIYNWRVKKATGKELIPNYDFWKSFPTYVKDGFLFTWYKLSCKKGEYQRLPS